MLRYLTTFIFMLSLASISIADTIRNVGGVELPVHLQWQQHDWTLNGAGMRNKMFMDLYVASLYVAQPSSDGAAIIAADEPMMIRLHITSSMITGKRMADSTRDGFVRATGGNLAQIEEDVNELIRAFGDDVNQGDVFDLVYEPETGVTVYHNGVAKSNVSGLSFKQALFGIWLSNIPVQKSLRKAMLNG